MKNETLLWLLAGGALLYLALQPQGTVTVGATITDPETGELIPVSLEDPITGNWDSELYDEFGNPRGS